MSLLRYITTVAGVPFTTLSQILPFILIGIGADDMVSQHDLLHHTVYVEFASKLCFFFDWET